MLVLHRDEAEPVLARHAIDCDTPIGALLRYRDGDGIMRLGLRPIARRFGASKQAVREDPGPAAGIAVDHQAIQRRHRHGNRVFYRAALETRVALAVDNAL